MKVFDIQNNLNEVDYKSTQEEKNTKRNLEEQLYQRKQELQKQLEVEYNSVEKEKNILYKYEDEKNELGR